MNTYECMVLLDNREVKKGWEPLKEQVAGMFSKHGAEILSSRRWDERPLAYPIRRQSRGTYLLIYARSEPLAVGAIRREMELSEVVLRNLFLVCEQIPEDAYQPEAAFDVAAIPAGDEPPAEPVAPEAKAEAKEAETDETEAEVGESADAEQPAAAATDETKENA